MKNISMTGNIKLGRNTGRESGFTLLETITVIAIFSLTVVATLNLYILFFKNQLQVERQTTVQADARFVLNAMMQALDTASIDYGYYAGPVPANPSVLALLTPQQETIRFRYSAADTLVEMCANRPVNSPCDDLDPAMWTPLNDETNSPVEAFSLWVSPSSTPFQRDVSGAAFSNEQPKVTVVLRLTDRTGENAMTLQTTLTSRIYER